MGTGRSWHLKEVRFKKAQKWWKKKKGVWEDDFHLPSSFPPHFTPQKLVTDVQEAIPGWEGSLLPRSCLFSSLSSKPHSSAHGDSSVQMASLLKPHLRWSIGQWECGFYIHPTCTWFLHSAWVLAPSIPGAGSKIYCSWTLDTWKNDFPSLCLSFLS